MKIRIYSLVAALLLVASTASATVTTVAWYKLGEADPGALAGNVGNTTTVDSGPNGFDLTQSLVLGTPTYSSSTSPSSPSSTLSMYFNSDGYYSRNAPVSTATTNVGMELWASFDTGGAGGQRWLISNGNAGGDGYAFQQNSSGDLIVWAPGTAVNTTVLTGIVANQWYHLGFVVDSVAGAKFYVDGAVAASFPSVTAIITPTDSFDVGISNALYGGHLFDGKIDNVRVFTFATGAFSPSDFLITPAPEPTTVILFGLGAIGMFRMARRRQNSFGTKFGNRKFSATSINVLTCCLVAALLAITSTASATITPVAWYKLGESDSPVGVGGGLGDPTTKDSVGTADLGITILSGAGPAYSSSTSPSSTGSTLSMNFSENGYYSIGSPVSTATTNVGIELWVNFATITPVAQDWLVANGNAGGDGYAFQEDGNGHLLFWSPGHVFYDMGLVTPNQWVHLGAVVDSTNGTDLYVNGTLLQSFAGATSVNTPTVSFTIGVSNALYPGHAFEGLIDNVRVFTFAQGAFSSSDFLISPTPEPTSVILFAFGAIGMFRIVRRRQP